MIFIYYAAVTSDTPSILQQLQILEFKQSEQSVNLMLASSQAIPTSSI